MKKKCNTSACKDGPGNEEQLVRWRAGFASKDLLALRSRRHMAAAGVTRIHNPTLQPS